MKIALALILIFTLQGCGSDDDYDQVNKDAQAPQPVKKKDQGTTLAGNDHPLIDVQPHEGWLWAILPSLGSVRCALKDKVGTNAFAALPTSIAGGALLGVIMHMSKADSHDLLRAEAEMRAFHVFSRNNPVDPKPDGALRPPQSLLPDKPFWRSVRSMRKFVGNKVYGGAVTALSCQMVLSGKPFPILDLFGQNSSATAAAVTLGGMTVLAAAPFVRNFFSVDPVAYMNKYDPVTRPRPTQTFNDVFSNIRDKFAVGNWGSWTYHELAPKLVVLGAGVGVGFVVDTYLQGPEEADCAK